MPSGKGSSSNSHVFHLENQLDLKLLVVMRNVTPVVWPNLLPLSRATPQNALSFPDLEKLLFLYRHSKLLYFYNPFSVGMEVLLVFYFLLCCSLTHFCEGDSAERLTVQPVKTSLTLKGLILVVGSECSVSFFQHFVLWFRNLLWLYTSLYLFFGLMTVKN